MKKVTILALIALALATSGCSRSTEARKTQAMDRGKHLLTTKDYPRAVLEFKTAAQADPKDAEAHYNLALAYIGTRDLASAVASLRKATELNPGHTNSQIKLAEILSTAKQPDFLKDAVKRMEAVLAATPNNPDALRTLAYAEYGLGETGDAEKHLVEAIENGPTDFKSAVSLAQVKISQKKPAEAEQILKKAAEH